jgi:hypothetical protein
MLANALNSRNWQMAQVNWAKSRLIYANQAPRGFVYGYPVLTNGLGVRRGSRIVRFRQLPIGSSQHLPLLFSQLWWASLYFSAFCDYFRRV